MSTTVHSVERAFSILETFDEDHPARTAADIAGLAGLTRPTTYRMLQTLQQLGYVRNRRGLFEVTPRVLRLGAGFLGRRSLAVRAQPVIEQLSERVGEHVAIGVLDGDDVITVAAANSPHSRFLAIAVQVGQRLPADRTSLGRILLAHRSGTVQDDADRIRHDGYVVTDGLLETGLRSLAVPIRDAAGEVVASMSVAVNAQRVSIYELERFLPHLREAADLVSGLA